MEPSEILSFCDHKLTMYQTLRRALIHLQKQQAKKKAAKDKKRTMKRGMVSMRS